MSRTARLALVTLTLAVASVTTVGCDVPTPLAPAEPIGAIPNWGESFATPTEHAGGSMLAPPQPGAPAAGTELGNTGLPAGTQSPGDTGEWSGGDPALGKGVWVAMCARCHGDSGEGGMQPGGVKVPALSDAGVQAALTDKQMARSIALGKGAMPSFMRELDKPKLSGVIAHIRSLKK
jgi:cytochrome c553